MRPLRAHQVPWPDRRKGPWLPEDWAWLLRAMTIGSHEKGGTDVDIRHFLPPATTHSKDRFPRLPPYLGQCEKWGKGFFPTCLPFFWQICPASTTEGWNSSVITTCVEPVLWAPCQRLHVSITKQSFGSLLYPTFQQEAGASTE